jgi:hypothetical protein
MIATTAARRIGTVLAATATLLVVAASAASAAPAAPAAPSAAAIGIAPVGTSAGYFTVTMRPGTSRRLAVEFSDQSQSPAQASTYAADVYTSVNGGFAARLEGQATTGVTKWLTYPAATVRLGANKTEKRTFTISVPSGATPGTHVTSVIVQGGHAAASTGPVTLSQVSRQALPIIIDVPGRSHPGLAIGPASQATAEGHTDLSVAVTNPGNIRIHPTGRLVVRNQRDVIVATVDVKMGTVFPTDTTTVRALLPTLLPAGHYTVTAALADKAMGVTATNQRTLDISTSSQSAAASPSQTIAGNANAASAAGPTSSSSTTPVALIGGLILAALIVGAGGAYGLTALRRRHPRTPTP